MDLKILGEYGESFLIEKIPKSQAKKIPKLIKVKSEITKLIKNKDVELKILTKIKEGKKIKDFKIIYFEKYPKILKEGSIIEAVGYFI